MHSPFLARLWNSSPASLTRAVQRRIAYRNCHPGWFAVKAGPLLGTELYLPNDKIGAWADMLAGRFDAFLYDALLARRKLADAVCWDIGAHIGYHTLGFAALGAQVLAFEPNPYNAARLKLHLERNTALAKRIRHLASAVSDRDGEMTFVQDANIDGGSSGSHLAGAVTPNATEIYSAFERVTVPTVRIDTLIEQQRERVPDVIKIDVEGAEALVLQGGANFFATAPPILLMEIHHIQLMFEVQKLLREWNYEIKLLDEAHATPSRCFLIAHR